MQPDSATFAGLLASCRTAKDYESASRVWDWMQIARVPSSTACYNELLGMHLDQDKPRAAAKAYQEMLRSGSQGDATTYRLMERVFMQLGDWAKVQAMVQLAEAEEQGQRRPHAADPAEIPRQMLRGEGLPSEALPPELDPALPASVQETALPTRPPAPSEHALARSVATAIQASGREGKLSRALEIYAAARAQGLKDSVLVFNALISACERPGAVDQALELLAEMRAAGLQPNSYTLGHFLKTCCRAGRWRDAVRQFSAMQSEGVDPSDITLTALIQTLCEAGQLDRALSTLQYMRVLGIPPNGITYQILVFWLAAEARMPEAVALVHEAVAAGAEEFKNRSDPADSALDLRGLTEPVAEVVVRWWLDAMARGNQGPSAALQRAVRLGLPLRLLTGVDGHHQSKSFFYGSSMATKGGQAWARVTTGGRGGRHRAGEDSTSAEEVWGPMRELAEHVLSWVYYVAMGCPQCESSVSCLLTYRLLRDGSLDIRFQSARLDSSGWAILVEADEVEAALQRGQLGLSDRPSMMDGSS